MTIYALIGYLLLDSLHPRCKGSRPLLKCERIVLSKSLSVVNCLGHNYKLDIVLQTIKVAFYAILNGFASLCAYIFSHPTSVSFLGGFNYCSAAAKRIKHHISLIAAGLDDAIQEGQLLLCRVADPFLSL